MKKKTRRRSRVLAHQDGGPRHAIARCRLAVQLSVPAYEMLLRLLESGFYGFSMEEVARRLIEQGLVEVLGKERL